ncbi:hypothetical protein OG21DRAFT_703565 [Imleria badia]|nr:hypothetical protein OG21DRAFT_703565 [Imleria badia]
MHTHCVFTNLAVHVGMSCFRGSLSTSCVLFLVVFLSDLSPWSHGLEPQLWNHAYPHYCALVRGGYYGYGGRRKINPCCSMQSRCQSPYSYEGITGLDGCLNADERNTSHDLCSRPPSSCRCHN